MTTKDIQATLIDLAQKELKYNKLARVVAVNYNKLDLRSHTHFYESIALMYRTFKKDTTVISTVDPSIHEADIEALRGRDLRIERISIANVRGIPDRYDNAAYGIDFMRGGRINNAVILAPNGTGKSSLFSAMEWIYAGEIGERQLRSSEGNLKDKDYTGYLERFGDEGLVKGACKVVTPSSEFGLKSRVFENEKIRSSINPDNHFISDYDVYSYGRLNYQSSDEDASFHNLIAKSMGLGDFLRFANILQGLNGYKRIKEANPLKKAIEEHGGRTREITNWKIEIDSKRSQLAQLEKGREQTQDAKDGSSRQQIETIDKLLRTNLDLLTQGWYEEYWSEIERFRVSYEESGIRAQRKSNAQLVSEFLNAGEKLLHEHDNEGCPFCEASTATSEEIAVTVKARIAAIELSLMEELALGKLYHGAANMLHRAVQDVENFDAIEENDRRDALVTPGLERLIALQEARREKLSHSLPYNLARKIQQLAIKPIPEVSDWAQLYELVIQEKVLIEYGFSSLLDSIKQYLEDRIVILHDARAALVKDAGEVLDIEQKAILNKEIAERESFIKSAEQRISSLDSEIARLKMDVSTHAEIKSEAGQFYTEFSMRVNQMVNEVFDPIKMSVETIMKEYVSQEEGIEFEIIQDKREVTLPDGEVQETMIISARIRGSSNDKWTTPDHYFNTFRYRIFCLMVSISLALSTRAKYRVNLPLVMDDLFFASDYVSKASFVSFLKQLIELFHKTTPELPFQFIMFTHDDMIFRSAMDALDDVKLDGIEGLAEECKLHPSQRTIFGRMFSPNDREDKKSLFAKGGDEYWNMVYSIPVELDKDVRKLMNV
jgi:hypothetical protein